MSIASIRSGQRRRLPKRHFDHFDFSILWLATHPQPNLPIHGQAAYLVDLDTRIVLWQRDPETSRAPASLTKLMTAMVAVDDAGSLDQVVTVTKAATQIDAERDGPHRRASASPCASCSYGLFLDSGNDAAEALARGIVPRDRFIRQMNQKAKSIGLTASHFVNPSGLDAPGHGMSAHDLAHVAAYLDKYYPSSRRSPRPRTSRSPPPSTHKAFYPHNLNRMLWSLPRRDRPEDRPHRQRRRLHGSTTATRNGRHLIAVVLNATGVSAADATVLLNYGFSVQPTLRLRPVRSPH